MPIKSLIRTVPHYPKQGVMFRDITTLLKDPVGFRVTINEFVHRYTGAKIDKIAAHRVARLHHRRRAGVSARASASCRYARKASCRPQTVGHDYELEYGFDRVELHVDAIAKGERVLLVDDLIATGGTAEAAIKLIEKMGGTVVEVLRRDRPARPGRAQAPGKAQAQGVHLVRIRGRIE